MRPLTDEEKQKVAELVAKITRDGEELYVLIAPIVSHNDFCHLMGGVRQLVFQLVGKLEDLQRIRSFFTELPESQDIQKLLTALDMLRT